MRKHIRKIQPGMFLLIALAVVTLILLWYSRLSFGAISTSNTGALTNRLSLTLFLMLITLAQFVHLQRANQTSTTNDIETRKITYRAWIGGFATTLIGIAGLIVYVDPLGIYGSDIYEPRLLAVRDDKLDAYDQLTETPDVVVLGSSRAFTVLPEFFEQDFGYSAFNMSVEGGLMDDFVIQMRYILERDPENPPKVLLIEITPPFASGRAVAAERSPLRLIPYMDRELQKLAIQAKIEGLFDLQELNEAIYSLRYRTLHSERPKSWTFDPDGGGSSPPQENLKAAVLAEMKSIKPPHCPRARLNPDGSRQLEQIVEMAEKHSISLIFYISPRHPDYFEKLVAGTRQFRQCQKAMRIYMDDLTSRYPFVFFLNYTRLGGIDGVADATGYYDSQHMTPLNNHYLVKAAAGTIRRAYAAAMQQRAQSG